MVASTQTADQLVTIADGAAFLNMPSTEITLARAQNGEGFMHAGMARLTLDAAHNDGSGDVHLFGTHYGTVADDQADIEVHPNAILYAEGTGDGDFTIRTVDQDPVYGITQSSDAGENGFKLTLLKPFLSHQAVVKPASTLCNVVSVNATSTDLTFKPTTGDTGAFDKITITHGTNKNKELCEALADIITDPRNQGKMIKFADAFNEKYFGNNAAEMTGVAFTLDS
tara:strand:+ start:787 stop:1464 length:678 start_codon:yes stop_codon:yes gene_type:complete